MVKQFLAIQNIISYFMDTFDTDFLLFVKSSVVFSDNTIHWRTSVLKPSTIIIFGKYFFGKVIQCSTLQLLVG